MSALIAHTGLAEPALSRELRYHLAAALEKDRAIPRPVPAAALRQEARRALAQYAPMLHPASREAIRDWALPLMLAVRNPPSDDAFAARLLAIGSTCAELPALAFNPRSSMEACRKFAFWPSAADIYALLRDGVAELVARVNALQDIAQAPPPAPPPPAPPRKPPPDAVAKAEVKRQLDGLRAALAEPETSPRHRGFSGSARPVPRELLARLYAQEGLPDPRAGGVR